MSFLLLSPKKNSKTPKTGQTKKNQCKQTEEEEEEEEISKTKTNQTNHTHIHTKTNKQTWSLLCVGQLPLSTGPVLKYA